MKRRRKFTVDTDLDRASSKFVRVFELQKKIEQQFNKTESSAKKMGSTVVKGADQMLAGFSKYERAIRQPDSMGLKQLKTKAQEGASEFDTLTQAQKALTAVMGSGGTVPMPNPGQYLSQTEYDYFFGGGQQQAGQMGMESDPLQKQLDMIDEHQAAMLGKATTFHNADQAIKNANAAADRMRLQASTDYEKEMAQTRLSIHRDVAGQIAGTFMQIAQAGGKHSEETFRLYQAFAITQAGISGALAFTKTLAEPALPWPGNVAMANIILGMAGVQAAMIAAAQPPSYKVGGISIGPESGYPATLHGTEAIVPLPNGRAIPVQIQGGGGPRITMINVQVAGDVYDRRTMSRLVASVSEGVARAVAPGAVKEAYRYNQGGMRDMLGGG